MKHCRRWTSMVVVRQECYIRYIIEWMLHHTAFFGREISDEFVTTLDHEERQENEVFAKSRTISLPNYSSDTHNCPAKDTIIRARSVGWIPSSSLYAC